MPLATAFVSEIGGTGEYSLARLRGQRNATDILPRAGVLFHCSDYQAIRKWLRMLIEAGFGKRVMFGSDQMVWPGVIEPAIAIIEEAPFLSEEQKRDIFHNNAARFLRLSEKEIARHHGK